MKLHDRKLVRLARHPESSIQEAKKLDQNKAYTSPLYEIEQETLLSYRLQQVKDLLTCLKDDLETHEYQELCDMIELLKDACVIIG